MDTDFDPLDDIFVEPVKNATPVGKFQPKARFRPTKKLSTETSVSTSQAVQNIDSTQTDMTEPVGNAKPSETCLDVPIANGRSHAFMEKSTGESSDVFIGLEALGDFLPSASSNMVTSNYITDSTVPPSEAIAINAPNPEDSIYTCKVADVATYPGQLEDINSLTAGDPIVQSSDGRDQMQSRELEREEFDAMGSANMTELTTNLEKNSVPTFQQDDDVLDLSSLDFSHTSPSEPTIELALNEESLNPMVTAQLESGVHLHGVPEIPTKLVSRRAKTGRSKTRTASNLSPEQQEALPSSQENETGKLLRPRRRKTNFCELVDEDEEVFPRVEFSEEFPVDTAFEEENINNDELELESESQMRKSKRKSEKTNDDKEKPSRRRKKAKEASDQEAGAKPKKFSHSTRRKRVVDKVLLETPEDEIDYQNVPLRDLIARAEHQEKQMKKDEAAAGAPVMKQSSSGLYNEDETFISKQDAEYDGEQGSPVAEEDTTVFFNYQTYMNKTPSTRWSKQDTELFYGAVRQFGTDLSMIQQLFPGRTRRQVKLKYKKEERQHPMRLRDALTNRTKDHSHFKKVIEILKQMAAEEKQSADEDDPIDLTSNEVADEGTLNADDEEPKGEHIQEKIQEEEEDNEEANDFVEADDWWSQYKSDT